MLVESRILALLVRGSHEFMTLILYPLPNPKLVLGRAKELRNLFGMFMALDKQDQDCTSPRQSIYEGNPLEVLTS